MENSYYKKMTNFMKKYNLIIQILAPTYGLYNCLKNRMTERDDRYILANDIKKFFLACSIYTLSWICIIDSIYESNFLDKSYLFLCLTVGVIISSIFLIKFNNNYSDNKLKKNIIIFNKVLLYAFISIFLIFIVCITFRIQVNYKQIIENRIFSPITYAIFIYILAISRPIHFILVFVTDIFKKIENPEKRTGIEKVRLLLISIGSYINIIVDYSILFYVMNKIGNNFDNLGNIIDIVYKTSGCGELEPTSIISKILIIMKSVSITILIAGNLAMYINMSTKTDDEVEEV